jgi:glutaconate CoA-transferase, subunit B
MSEPATPEETMVVNASRELRNGQVCLVGVGPPNAATNLARRLHAPDCVLVYESGAIGAKPVRLPLSIGDDDLAETAQELVSVPEIFNYWVGAGRIDVGFLGAAQIDPRGNLNTTAIGPYDEPKVRLPGAGGAPEIAACAKSIIVIVRHSPRTFVERLDFVTSLAHQRGHTVVITDLGVLRPDADGELELVAVHPGVEPAAVQEATGWDLREAASVDHTTPVTQAELDALRELRASARR